MRKFEKLSRKYKYEMRQKYQEDPFAFLVLWSLFFSAVFLVFAFRGLIAATFMHKIDVSNDIANSVVSNTDNTTTNNAVNNSTNNSVGNSVRNNTSDNNTANSTNSEANTVQ